MPTTTIFIPADLGSMLDTLAWAQGSNSQELALRALRAFLAAADERRITYEALAELDRGEGIPADQVREEMAALLAEHGINGPQQASIRARAIVELSHE